jgi:type I restriction enzyme, S subunit
VKESAQRLPTARQRFIRYPAYKDSGVEWLGEIPAHWEALALKRLVDHLRPVTYGIVQCGPDCTEGVPYIRPVDMDDEGGIKAGTLQQTTHEIAAAYARSTVRPGDIVVSIGPSFGKVMIVPVELAGANLTQGTARVAPSRRITSQFLFWALRSRSIREGWDSLCAGATFRALTLETLSTCALALPLHNEQHAIVAFLDRETTRIDALVAKKKRLIELLQEKRTALITNAVTKGLHPNVPVKDSGVEWVGEIPAHWQVKRLWHLTPAGRRIMYGIVLPGPNVEDGIAIVKGGDVSSARLHLSRLNRTTREIERGYVRSRLRGGDLVFAIRGSIGEVAMVPDELEGANLTQDAARISYTDATHGPWLLLALKSSAIFARLESGALGATILGINIRDLKRASICVPPLLEQRSIAAFLGRETARIDSLIAKVRDAIDRLKEFRTALISAAVTGKIDVREEAA